MAEFQSPSPPVEAVRGLKYCNRIVAEINNIGTHLHERGKLNEAAVLYYQMMQAVVLVHELGTGVQQQHTRECKDKLEDLKVAAQNLCNASQKMSDDNDMFSTQIGSHHQLPNNFSQPCMIDINDHDVIEDNQMALILLHNMALIQMHKGKFHEATGLLHQALSQVTRGIDARGTSAAFAFVAVHYNLGQLYHHEGRVHESYKVLVRAVSQGRRALGSDHLLIANVLNAVGRILISQGFSNEAMGVFKEYSRIYDRHDIKTMALSLRGNSRSDESAAPMA